MTTQLFLADEFLLMPKSPPASWESSRAFWGSYRKGWHAPARAICPYRDFRSGRRNTKATYSSAWRKFWQEGHEDAAKGRSRYFQDLAHVVSLTPSS